MKQNTVDTTKRIPWKHTQVNLCYIFVSQLYNNGQFKDLKCTISIKCNEKLSCKV